MPTTEPPRTPRTERGQRTRDHLITAARTVFERQGYGATRMGDIAAEAGVSHGTVYTYFETKADVLAATLEQFVTALRQSINQVGHEDPGKRLAHANASYVSAYVTHARLVMVMEEAAMSDESFARALLDLRRGHVKRVAQQIRRQQEAGRTRADVSADTAALALCAMVEGFARFWAQSEDPTDPSGAATVTQLWLAALERPRIARNDQHHVRHNLEETSGVHN
jgi:AcrR family transcriptional regulator